jgi:hypothetical protein
MRHSESLTKIAPALVKALGKIEGAAKTATNGGFKTKYATLESVIDSSRDILTEHGLTLIQLPGACASGVLNLETILMHESGEWISGEMGIALGKTDPQGVGSALTYARRYAQMAALNMPAVDDDAEAAMGRGSQPQRTTTPALVPAISLAVDFATKALKSATSGDDFKAIWEKNKAGWKDVMSDADYAKIVGVMQEEAKRFARAAA